MAPLIGNPFNLLNRLVALTGVPSDPLTTILIKNLLLFEVTLSEEGTTQGDPLAMPMYTLAIPLTSPGHCSSLVCR